MWVDISSNIYEDTEIDIWLQSQVILNGSKNEIRNIIRAPITDKQMLIERQIAIKQCDDFENAIYVLAEYENDVNWALELSETIEKDEEKATMFEMLYPTDWYFKYLCYYNPILSIYHGYKIYLTPLITLSTPISVFLMPYYLFKNTFLKMSFSEYLITIKDLIRFAFDSKMSFTSFITYIVYIIMYLYGVYQHLDLCYKLHTNRMNLLKAIEGVAKFVRTAKDIFNNIQDVWSPFRKCSVTRINNFSLAEGNLSDVFSLWQSSTYRDELKNILEIVYTLDVVSTLSKLYHNEYWCIPTYVENDSTILIGMRNPLLDSNQVSNPVLLDKHFIISGANQSGKTLYCKSIATNYILAQSVGIVMCSKAKIKIVDCIYSYMRVSDVIGKSSYFQAESECCQTMLAKLKTFEGKNTLFFLDEPLNGTVAIEGESMAYAFCKYIALNSSTLKCIVSTHFRSLTSLEKDYPKLFKNLSTIAIPLDDYRFKFPYNIRNQPSFQCIALELLRKTNFPQTLIEDAIKCKKSLTCD